DHQQLRGWSLRPGAGDSTHVVVGCRTGAVDCDAVHARDEVSRKAGKTVAWEGGAKRVGSPAVIERDDGICTRGRDVRYGAVLVRGPAIGVIREHAVFERIGGLDRRGIEQNIARVL